EVDEPRAEGRLVLGPHQRRRIDLHAVDRERAAGAELLGQRRIVAQSVAGRDQRVGTGVAIEVALAVIAILQVDAAGRLAMAFGESYGVFLWRRHPDRFRRRIVRALAPVAQHLAVAGIGELRIVEAVLDLAALGEIQEASVVEGDDGDRKVLLRLDRQLPARIAAEAAVLRNAHGPN